MSGVVPSTARTEMPACRGGQPVRSQPLRYASQVITEEDCAAVLNVLRSEWLTSGPTVEQFEQAFAAQVGAVDAVTFSSGTAALHAAVEAVGIGPGDEVITSPLTFCATANAVLYAGGHPRFADVDPVTLTIDPAQVERQLTPRTKALLPVDYAGHPASLDALLALADQHGVVVIEDACHALGATWHGRRIGSISHVTAFSFHPVKHLTTGEGGMVTTNSAALAAQLRLLRDHGLSRPVPADSLEPWRYEMKRLGFNYRLNELACALGLSQLRRLEQNIARRRQIAEAYRAAFHDLAAVRVPQERAGAVSAWHLYPIRVVRERWRVTRADVFRALRAENIGVQVHYIPVPQLGYYRERFGYQGGEFPVAEHAYEELISLPMWHGMSDGDVRDVIDAMWKLANFFGC